MRLTRENIHPCIYQVCYRGAYVQFKQGYTSLHKTSQKNPSENGIEIFVERFSKLVEITFWFVDPEDFKSSVKKEILMNITDGHCDDLEDGNITDHAGTLVIATILLMLLTITMMIIIMKRGK